MARREMDVKVGCAWNGEKHWTYSQCCLKLETWLRWPSHRDIITLQNIELHGSYVVGGSIGAVVGFLGHAASYSWISCPTSDRMFPTVDLSQTWSQHLVRMTHMLKATEIESYSLPPLFWLCCHTQAQGHGCPGGLDPACHILRPCCK